MSGTSGYEIHSGTTMMSYTIPVELSSASGYVVMSGVTGAWFPSPQVRERIVYRNISEPKIITKEVEKIVYKEIPVKEIHIYHEKEEGMSLTSLGGIVLVIVICLITVKFIAPRVTLRNAVRWFWHLIWKPGKEAKAEVSSEWDKVQKEDKE